MADRVTETTVTFTRPFTLSSLDSVQPPGVYRVVIDEEEVLGLSFLAYHRRATSLHIPAISAAGGHDAVFVVDPAELRIALAADVAVG